MNRKGFFFFMLLVLVFLTASLVHYEFGSTQWYADLFAAAVAGFKFAVGFVIAMVGVWAVYKYFTGKSELDEVTLGPFKYKTRVFDYYEEGVMEDAAERIKDVLDANDLSVEESIELAFIYIIGLLAGRKAPDGSMDVRVTTSPVPVGTFKTVMTLKVKGNDYYVVTDEVNLDNMQRPFVNYVFKLVFSLERTSL